MIAQALQELTPFVGLESDVGDCDTFEAAFMLVCQGENGLHMDTLMTEDEVLECREVGKCVKRKA